MTTVGGAKELQPGNGMPAVVRRVRDRSDAVPEHTGRQATGVAGFLPDPFAPPGEVTLALVGGQRLLRDATASLLASEDDLTVLGTFESVDLLLEAEMWCQPDLLLLDCDEAAPACWRRAIGMLGSSSYHECRIAMLCGEVNEEVIRCAIEQRVSGVILKSYSTQEIREALVYIATGRTIMPAGWQRAFARPAAKPLGLSPRHRQILALIAQGHGNEEIAGELQLSPNTVKFHIRVLYSRLGVRNRVEAANRHVQMTRGGA